MFTHVYSCLPIFILVYLCLPLFTHVYLILLVFTYVYNCLLVHVYLCFTHDYSCLPMFTLVYLCLPLSAAAQQLCSKLKAIDEEFKAIHFQIVDLLDKDEDLDREQVIFDEHEDRVTAFLLHIPGLTHSPTPAVRSSEKNLASK